MLKIKNISLDLGDFSLKNINLNIPLGEYFVILGPSGNGKTVFLETLAGMYESFKGEVIYGDKIISNIEMEKREIGFVYQKHELFNFLNVENNIAFGLKVKGEKKDIIKEKVDRYLKIFGGSTSYVFLSGLLLTQSKGSMLTLRNNIYDIFVIK